VSILGNILAFVANKCILSLESTRSLCLTETCLVDQIEGKGKYTVKRQFRPFGYKEELYRQSGVVVEARISRKSAVGVHGNHWIIGAYRTDSNGDIVTKIEGEKKVEDQLTIEEIQEIDSKLIEILDVIVGKFHRSIPRSRRVENGTGLASRAYFPLISSRLSRAMRSSLR